MGIKTTHYITRETAMAVMFSRLQQAKDEDLADMLESFPESHFRNYCIISKEEIEELDDFDKVRTIKDVTQF